VSYLFYLNPGCNSKTTTNYMVKERETERETERAIERERESDRERE
jgi:hypothetical protein